ncbi:MAG: hypothetical protein U0905_19155 [Pirellulales bacterium]
MDSAYKAPLASCRLERRERKVLAYWMIALLLLSCALLVSFPGLVLLNQELRWIPTDGWISEVRYGQTPVPLRTAMRDSLLSAFVIGLTGTLFAVRGFRNSRWNARSFSNVPG